MKRHLLKYRWRYGIIAYVLIALMMFGHRAARYDLDIAKAQVAYDRCIAANEAGEGRCYQPRTQLPDIFIPAAIAGVFWPIDLVWIGFDKLEGVPQ